MRLLALISLLLFVAHCEKKEESTCQFKISREQLVGGEAAVTEGSLKGTRKECEQKCTNSINQACSQNKNAKVTHTCHWKDWTNDGKVTCPD